MNCASEEGGVRVVQSREEALERLSVLLDEAKCAVWSITELGYRPRVVNQIDLKLDEARMWFEELTRA